jgi:acetoin utilization deacetylase AcuC-like enzyme
MIHDVAVAIRRLQRDDKIRTAMTVDCDVHQGNGTAAIFAGKRTPASSALARGRRLWFVATIPRHPGGAARTPATSSPSRCTSTITIRCGSRPRRSMSTCPMAPATMTTWRGSTTRSAPGCGSSSRICCAIIAGADPYKEDQLGGLSLTIEGLKKRDELVFRVARARHSCDGDLRRRLRAECGRHRDHSQQHSDRGERSVRRNEVSA